MADLALKLKSERHLSCSRDAPGKAQKERLHLFWAEQATKVVALVDRPRIVYITLDKESRRPCGEFDR